MSGLESYARIAALEGLFNLTETTYVALLETLPVDSAGEVEISPAGYVRVLNQSWSTSDAAGVTTRQNVPAIAFGPYGEDIATRGWAIYDAPAGGNLLASGLLFDTGGGQAGEVTVSAGDDIQFQPGDLGITLADSCPVVFGASGDTCSAIDSIQVSVSGGAPVAWSIGDPPIVAGASTDIDIFITLVAPSTDMPGFTASVTNASGISIVDAGPNAFLVQYDTGLAGVQNVTVENTGNSPVCEYILGGVTTVA